MEELKCSEEEIKNISKNKFKLYLRTKILEGAFQYLQKSRKRLKKGSQIEYTKFSIQNYLKSNELKFEEKIFLFKIRCEMTNVKVNFSKMYVDNKCDLCIQDQIQSDSHLLECLTIINNCPELKNDNETEYQDLFDSMQSQIKAVKIFMTIFKIKEEIEERAEETEDN